MTGPTTVEVKGGPLCYDRSGTPGGRVVLAAHGLTSHRGAWHRVRSFLPDVEFVAVDLRGRGESRELPGPSSIGQHAEDLLRLADGLDAERVVVAGHSMGGFVALAFAAAHPGRTAGIVLVDGGLRLPPAPTDAREPAVMSDLDQVLSRLGQTYGSREQYRDFWRTHPATGPYWNDAIEHYVDTDLHGSEPSLYPGANPDRVREDMVDMFGSAAARDPLLGIVCPAIALRAERGLLDQPEGLYPPGVMQEIAATAPLLEVREVADVNHYTILLADRGAEQVADAIRDVSAPSRRATGALSA
jgi:lipase